LEDVHSEGVELSFRQVSGLRPFVVAEVNGCPVSLMVHSNAGFRAMVTHEVATRADLHLARRSSEPTTESRRSAGSAVAAAPLR
jgi:hypothetical protein